MRFYSFDDIRERADCRDIARELLNADLNGSGRCAALWRGGTNPSSVAIEAGKWHDHGAGTGGGPVELAALAFDGDIQQAQQWIGDRYALTPKNETRKLETANGTEPETVFTYQDADGKTVLQVVRKPGKKFVQRKPDGNGWTYKVKDVPPVPYRLPEIVKAIEGGETVFVVEGERDSNNLAAAGLTATCNAGGAGNWTAKHSEHLKGASVVILPDNDEPGRRHGRAVAMSLNGRAASVRIVETSDREKGDVSDWLADGGTVEKLRDMVEAAPEFDPAAAIAERYRSGAEIIETMIPAPDELVEGLADVGDKLFLIGSSKARKSFFALQIAMHLASGGRAGLPFPVPKRRRVMFLNLEIQQNHFERRVQRMAEKLNLTGSDLSGLHIEHRRGRPLGMMDTAGGLEPVAEDAKAIGAQCVILDPAYKLSFFDEIDPSLALAEFDRFAESTGAALIVVHHEKKGIAGDRQAVDRGSGSGKMARDYDAAIFLAQHRDELDAVVYSEIQRNYPPRPPGVLQFEHGAFHVSDAAPVEATSQTEKQARARRELDDDSIFRIFGKEGPMPSEQAIRRLMTAGLTKEMARERRNVLVDNGTLARWREPGKNKPTYIGTPAAIAAMISRNPAELSENEGAGDHNHTENKGRNMVSHDLPMADGREP